MKNELSYLVHFDVFGWIGSLELIPFNMPAKVFIVVFKPVRNAVNDLIVLDATQAWLTSFWQFACRIYWNKFCWTWIHQGLATVEILYRRENFSTFSLKNRGFVTLCLLKVSKSAIYNVILMFSKLKNKRKQTTDHFNTGLQINFTITCLVIIKIRFRRNSLATKVWPPFFRR